MSKRRVVVRNGPTRSTHTFEHSQPYGIFIFIFNLERSTTRRKFAGFDVVRTCNQL